MRAWRYLSLALVALMVLGCGGPAPTSTAIPGTTTPNKVVSTPVAASEEAPFNTNGDYLRILGSPPFRVIKPAIDRFNKKYGKNVQLRTVPSGEIMQQLKDKGGEGLDAVAP